MGDNMLRRQAANFKRRCDLSRLNAQQPGLYARPEFIETIYNANPLDFFSIDLNERLFAFPSRDRPEVVLTKGHKKVATIDGEAGRALAEALREPDAPGGAVVCVVNKSKISGTVSVTLART